jgi:hypothetical protein
LQVIFGLAAFSAVVWVVRSCVVQRKLTFDAKLLVGWCSVLWIDQTANWIRPQVIFNSYYVNRGSWYGHIPGWISRNAGRLPAPFFVEAATYVFMVLITVGGCAFMRRVRRSWPKTGNVGLVLSSWLAMTAFVFVIEEIITIRAGNAFVWIGSVHALTPWNTSKWAIPLTECFGWGATITALVALRYFRGPGGDSVVDRGLGRVRRGPAAKAALSLLAVIGFATVAQAAYGAMSASLTLYDGPTPKHMPSYILNGVCGPGTPYACPGPKVPILLK